MYLSTTLPAEIADQITSAYPNKTIVISLAEDTDLDVLELITAMNERSIPFIGGVFPKIIFGNQTYESGMIVTAFDHVEHTFLVEGLDTSEPQIPEMHLDPAGTYFLFTFADGLATNLSSYLSELYNYYGSNLSYFGCGAGSLSLEQMPCVFNEKGIYQDAAVGILVNDNIALGVRHGWTRVTGPLIATKTERNVIHQINWQNAFEVYQAIVEDHGKQHIAQDNFFEISKAYPFGILKDDTEYIVRDPIAVNDEGSLICIGDVTENTVLDVLHGNQEDLINAAKSAAEAVIGQLESPRQAFLSDCISRVLFLEENYNKELDAVVKALNEDSRDISVEGALTLGEISSFGDGYLQVFNKTIVIGLFE